MTSDPSHTTSPAGAGYFAYSELKELNSGYYHDDHHALEVAELVSRVAKSMGRPAGRREFLKQVALIHDADPRDAGTPARVQSTLTWMEAERERLAHRFGWDGFLFEEARSLIARTDFPFDRRPRTHGTPYDGMSPVEVYEKALKKLPSERRAACMRDALTLRFCDQIAAYVGSYQRARDSVQDLVDELNNTGLGLSFESTLRNTPDFLNQIGTDLSHDETLKTELNLAYLVLPTRARLLRALHWTQTACLIRNTLRLRFA